MALKEYKFALMRGLDEFCHNLQPHHIEELLYEKQSLHVVMNVSNVLTDFTERKAQFFLAGKSQRFCEFAVSHVEEQKTHYTATLTAKTRMEPEESLRMSAVFLKKGILDKDEQASFYIWAHQALFCMNVHVKGFVLEEEILELAYPGTRVSVYCVLFRRSQHSLVELSNCVWKERADASGFSAEKLLFIALQVLESMQTLHENDIYSYKFLSAAYVDVGANYEVTLGIDIFRLLMLQDEAADE